MNFALRDENMKKKCTSGKDELKTEEIAHRIKEERKKTKDRIRKGTCSHA
jgi:hypothetical protein